MRVEEILAHADRLAADLEYKQRQIRTGEYGVYGRETLARQVGALQARVSEIRSECLLMQAGAPAAG